MRSATASSGCTPAQVVRDSHRSIQVNVDARGCNILGDAANEPSIAIDPTEPRKIAIGWRQFDSVQSDFRQAGYAYSQDSGHTWVFPGAVRPGEFGSDPVLASNADGVFYYVSIDVEKMRVFRSFDQGIAWPLATQAADYFYDKPWMAIDRTEGVGRNNIYITAPNGSFKRSTDSGASFEDVASGVGSTGWTLDVGPDGCVWTVQGAADGAASRFGPGFSCTAAQSGGIATFERKVVVFGVSNIGGRSCGSGGTPGQPWIAIDKHSQAFGGTIYVCLLGFVDPNYEDLIDVVLLRSSDHGATWSNYKRINDDPFPGPGCQWFPMISIAPNGRIDAVWNDTRNAPNSAFAELFYSYSLDAGDSWSPNVAVSPLFDGAVGFPFNNEKLGDYYHMLSDNLGVNVAYAATFNGEQDVYFLRIGPWDCNGNEIDDAVDIANATSRDCNGNGVPDECEYRADANGDGLTTYNDFAMFLDDFTGPVNGLLKTDPPSSPLGKGGGKGPLLDSRGTDPLAHARGSDLVHQDAPYAPDIPLAHARGSEMGCSELSDIDHDGDVDLADFYGVQRAFITP